ncbi:hypothetical protein B566_EDAN013339, partial [Ephemera danica]
YIKENKDINVIIIEWVPYHKIFRIAYNDNRSATRNVGNYVADMIQHLRTSLNISPENFHCVGYSLGAHVCGYAGKKLTSEYNLTLQRITGLDPAGPLFHYNITSQRLDKTDAIFVDVIHTCTNILGFPLSIGHIDFYPNSGKGQLGCGYDFVILARIITSLKVYLKPRN